MGPPSSSIMSYFTRSSSPSSSPVKLSTPTKSGITQLSSSSPVLSPSKWKPEVHYTEVDIGSLLPGPSCITFMGRIVNFYDQTTTSKMPKAAKGCLKMIAKDDTGALTVKIRLFSGRKIFLTISVLYYRSGFGMRNETITCVWVIS